MKNDDFILMANVELGKLISKFNSTLSGLISQGIIKPSEYKNDESSVYPFIDAFLSGNSLNCRKIDDQTEKKKLVDEMKRIEFWIIRMF